MTDSEDAEDFDKAEITSLLEKSTLCSRIDVAVDGNYPSEEDARKVGETVLFFLKVFGAFLQLDGLEVVNVADDYNAALAKVERGFATNAALTPTNDQFGAGFAMAVPVVRNGAVKTNIVMHSVLAKPLLDPDNEWYSFAVHTLAHETAHAHDHEIMARTLPGLLGTQIWDFREGNLFKLAHGCWSEYIASQLSARWGTETYISEFEPSLCDMLSTVRDRGTGCIYGHSQHGNIVDTEAEMRDIYGTILVRSSYVVGHIHGIESAVDKEVPRFYSLMNETPWFKPIFERYESNLRAMNDTYGSWAGIEVFNPLIETCEALLSAGGMTYVKLPDGGYYVGLNYPKD